MLQIIAPVALVSRAIAVRILAVAMRLISLPLTLILISIDVPKGALTMGFVVLPETLVLGAVGPDLRTLSVADVFFPLAFVLSLILKCKLISLFVLREILRLTLSADLIPVVFSTIGELVSSLPPQIG